MILPCGRRICLGPAGQVRDSAAWRALMPVTELIGRLGRTPSGGSTFIELVLAS